MPSMVNMTRTGQVFLRNFDAGIVETLGAEVRVREINSEKKQSYFIDIEGAGVDIPVIMASPEVVFEKTYLPSIIIRREEPAFAANRWPSIGSAYRMPTGPSVTVGTVVGKKNMEIAPFAYPFDITYALEGVTRLRGQAVAMLNRILHVYKPYGKVRVKDSLGEMRSYEAFMEGIANLDEVVDAAERMSGFAVTLRVVGELDLVEPFTTTTASQEPQRNTSLI